MNKRKRTPRRRGTLAMEQKYQAIKGEDMFVSSDEQAYRTVRVASFTEYMKTKDAQDIISIKNAVENTQRFFTPKGRAQEQFLKHFGRKAKGEGMAATRTDKIASFVLQMKQGLRINRLAWHRRDRDRPRAEGRFGSSLGKISGTEVKGADTTYDNLEDVSRAVNNMFVEMGKAPNITVTIRSSRGTDIIGRKK